MVAWRCQTKELGLYREGGRALRWALTREGHDHTSVLRQIPGGHVEDEPGGGRLQAGPRLPVGCLTASETPVERVVTLL